MTTEYIQQQLKSSANMDQQRQPEPEMELNRRPQSRKVQVVYYLYRNQQLEHPHFIEVALVSPDGLYLRDVIKKFNSLRGRGMGSMYSWSCKSYKNAFVWNDLCEDDLIVPAHENEYVLKGSELVEDNNSGCFTPARSIKSRNLEQLDEPRSSSTEDGYSSSRNIIDRETKMSQDDDGYHSLTTYKIYKCSHRLADASTQTDEHVKVQETCTRSLLTDNGAVGSLSNDSIRSSFGAYMSIGKTDTLESLMKAEDNNLNTNDKLEEQQEEEYQVPTDTKFRASSMLLQLISCGSISSHDHDFSQALSYRSRSTNSKLSSSLLSSFATLGDLDCLSENPILEDKQYFSGSLIETKSHKKEEINSLKQSSSNSVNRINKCASTLTCTKCIPRSIMGSLSKHPRIALMRFSESTTSCILSPCIFINGSKRIAVACLSKKPSKRIESFRDDKENVIKIEERLASGARVIIHLESNDRSTFTR